MTAATAESFDETVSRSPASTTTLEEFRIARVFRRALEVCWARLPAFCVIALLAQAPSFVLLITQGAGTPQGLPVDLQILDQLLGELLVGAVAFGTIMHVRGRPTSVGRSVNAVLVSMLQILGIGLITGLAFFMSRWLPLLIVPGIYLAVVFFLAVPIVLVERTGIIASLQHSARRTDGHRLRIFGLLAALVGVALLLNAVLRSALGDGALHSTLYLAVAIEIALGIYSAAVLGITYCELHPTASEVS